MQWHCGCLNAERACVLAFLMLRRIKFCDVRCYCIVNSSLWRIDSVARGHIHAVLLLGQEITWLIVMY